MDNKKEKKRFKNRYTEGLSLSDKIVKPKREWFILLTVFVLSFVCVVVFNVYMYINITNGDMYVSVNKEELVIENLKVSSLDKVIKNIELKNLNFTNLRVEKLTDPSI
jgi:hypothetical protein